MGSCPEARLGFSDFTPALLSLRRRSDYLKTLRPGFEPGIPFGSGFQDRRNTRLCDRSARFQVLANLLICATNREPLSGTRLAFKTGISGCAMAGNCKLMASFLFKKVVGCGGTINLMVLPRFQGKRINSRTGSSLNACCLTEELF